MLETHSTALDGMVLRDKRIVSFRTLSSELGIPTKQAQHLILEYIENHADKVVPSWAVTSLTDEIKRVSLVQGSRPDVGDTTVYVAVWGIRSSDPDTHNTDVEGWMGTDRMRELAYLRNSPVGSSELHVNSWNPIKSGTAAWNTQGASTAQVNVKKEVKAEAEPVKAAKKNGFNSDIVTKVKAEAAAKRNGKKGNGIQFKPRASNGKKADTKSLASRSQSKVKKEAAIAETAAPVTKKSRRRIVESDEEESDDDDCEESQREREALEREEREAEEAELERKVSKEEDVPADEVESVGNTQKRPFGGGSQQKKKNKYRCIEVEETVVKPNGYIETVRVKKYVDDAGNEKPAGEAENTPPTDNGDGNDVVVVEKTAPKKKKERDTLDAAKKKGAANEKANGASQKKEVTANGKANGSSQKKNKSNASIKSFFKKK